VADSAAETWQRAVRLLAARDRSEHEMRNRLAAAGAPPAAIAATVSRLHALRYLDDRRVAREAAESAVRKGRGSGSVRARLARRGVPESAIDAAVEAAFGDERELARRVLAQRYRAAPCSLSERTKAARFLVQRGFPEAVVLAILGEGC
jgi:regulatory protein